VETCEWGEFLLLLTLLALLIKLLRRIYQAFILERGNKNEKYYEVRTKITSKKRKVTTSLDLGGSGAFFCGSGSL